MPEISRNLETKIWLNPFNWNYFQKPCVFYLLCFFLAKRSLHDWISSHFWTASYAAKSCNFKIRRSCDVNANLLLKMEATLQSGGANHPLLAYYHILFSFEHRYSSNWLQRQKFISYELTLANLHTRNESKNNSQSVCLVSCLNFDRLWWLSQRQSFGCQITW